MKVGAEPVDRQLSAPSVQPARTECGVSRLTGPGGPADQPDCPMPIVERAKLSFADLPLADAPSRPCRPQQDHTSVASPPSSSRTGRHRSRLRAWVNTRWPSAIRARAVARPNAVGGTRNTDDRHGRHLLPQNPHPTTRRFDGRRCSATFSNPPRTRVRGGLGCQRGPGRGLLTSVRVDRPRDCASPKKGSGSPRLRAEVILRT